MGVKSERERRKDERVLEKARQILASRQYDEELKLALQSEVKVNLRNIVSYSHYYQGARKALGYAKAIAENPVKGDEKVYRLAELELALKSLRNVQLFLEGTYEIGYRNFETDKKGKIIKCEAYFCQRVEILSEVK